MICQECKKDCKTARGLHEHIRKWHNGLIEYQTKYKSLQTCKTCGIITISKSGYCNSHNKSGTNNPFFGKTHPPQTVDRIKAKTRSASINLWKNNEYRTKVISGASKPRHSNFAKEQSVRMTQWYINNPEQKTIRSVAMKQSWADGKIEPNINSINESKGELELRRLCNEKFNLVQKKTLKIDGKWFYPDILINGTHIVEFYGDYWHANPNTHVPTDMIHNGTLCEDIWHADDIRINLLTANGYHVKVIWQSEFNTNRDEVMSQIEEWYNETSNNSKRV